MNGNRLTVNTEIFKRVKFILPLCFCAILALFFCFYDQSGFGTEINSLVAEFITVSAIIISVIAGYFQYLRHSLNTKTLIVLVFICGFALRLAYAVRFGCLANQHDVETLNSSGHLSYINFIAENFNLPNSNTWQFSHPPLHHILAAFVVKIGELFGFSFYRCYENVQLLTVGLSTATMFIGYSICKNLKVNGKNLLFCTVILAFNPVFQILAGSINNDTLLVALSMTAVLFLVKWYNSPSLKYAILIGLFIGLAMMTKVSAALIAVVTAITVVIKFAISKELKFGNVLLQTVCFLLIMLPLGLCHPIRNYILFEQPFGYVAPISTSSPLYIGDYSLIERILLPFSLDKTGIYVDVWSEYNLWQYVLRNSLFGEYNFGNLGFAFFTVLLNLLLIILSVAAFFFVLIKRKYRKTTLPIIILAAIQIAFFVYFNIKYPFGCSMDFRYIVPTVFCGVALIGVLSEYLQNSSSLIGSCILKAERIVIILFAVSSFVVMM